MLLAGLATAPAHAQEPTQRAFGVAEVGLDYVTPAPVGKDLATAYDEVPSR